MRKKPLVEIYEAPTEGSRTYVAIAMPCSTIFKNYPADNSSIPDMANDIIKILDLAPRDRDIEFPKGIKNRYVGKENEAMIRAAFKERRSREKP